MEHQKSSIDMTQNTELKEREIYHRWAPIRGLSNTLFCRALVDDLDGLSIYLCSKSDKENLLRVFCGGVLVYRSMDEVHRARTYADHINGSVSYPLRRVENSSFIDWFQEESKDILGLDPIFHYLITTPDDWIDVLERNEPHVSWVKASSVRIVI